MGGGGVREMERWLNWPVIATVCANGDNRTRRLELYQMTWTRPEYVNNNFVIKRPEKRITVKWRYRSVTPCRKLEQQIALKTFFTKSTFKYDFFLSPLIFSA